MSSISIIRQIRSILLNNSSLVELLGGNKIFPLVAEAETKNPFIVIKRNSLTVSYTKDFNINDDNIIILSIIADDYEKVVAIAEEVRNSLENYRDNFILESRITNVSDNYNYDIYNIDISFKIKTK
ncbi:MAG: hypothetical protein ACI30M_02590 [Muribaculaceae bacterium]